MLIRGALTLAVFVWALHPLYAADKEALTLVQRIEMPGVEGRIDHLAADIVGKRLFVAALGNNTIEVIDLAAGKRMEFIKGVKEPQGIRFLADSGDLFIGSGENGSCEVFQAQSLKPLASIKLGDDADNVRYDPESKRIYVGYGEGAIGVIDAVKRTKIADIPLNAHPESFQLESKGKRIFVNVPRAMQIAVIDRSRNAVIATWPVHEAHNNYPMALDESHHRLFVGCRKPAKLLVVDTESGQSVASLDCCGDTDDVFYDASLQRVYVCCGEGFVDVFERTEGDHYSRVQHLPAAAGARTALFVPELKALYLAVPNRGPQKSEIQVYKTRQP